MQVSQFPYDYRVTMHHEDDVFWAEVAELPGCFASGETKEELWEALTEAIGLYLSNGDDRVVIEVKSKTLVEESDTFTARLARA